MKKVFLLLLCAVFLGATPAFALFTNGGFETGTFTGWNLDFGYNPYNNTADVVWNHSNHGLYGIWSASSTMSGQTLNVDPWDGTYMARINDIAGGSHATKLWQTDTIKQEDIDNGAKVYVDWGAMLIDPGHPAGSQPFFGINVLIGGSVATSFYADASAHQAGGWTQAGSYGGSSLWYKADQWSFNLASYAVGTAVTIEMYVVDCDWGGHGGYAFLDGVGTIQPPPVSEPATMLLLGSGLVGLAGFRKKFRG